ncbi:MAG: hypothetical protein ACK5MQ_07295 [Pikeienuella sp.]
MIGPKTSSWRSSACPRFTSSSVAAKWLASALRRRSGAPDPSRGSHEESAVQSSASPIRSEGRLTAASRA